MRVVSILEGDAVTKLIFLDWPSGGSAKQVTRVAKKAVARIAAGELAGLVFRQALAFSPHLSFGNVK